MIVHDNHHGQGRKRNLVGMKLKDALKGLGRSELDVVVEVFFARRDTACTLTRISHTPKILDLIGDESRLCAFLDEFNVAIRPKKPQGYSLASINGEIPHFNACSPFS